MGLLDAKDVAGFGLGQAARPDETVDLQGQLGLEQFSLRMGQAQIGEDIAAAFRESCRLFLGAMLIQPFPMMPFGVR